MHRVLLDTNILIAAAYNPHSASSRIVNMVERGELKLIVSPAIEREYERLIPPGRSVPSKARMDLASSETRRMGEAGRESARDGGSGR